MSDHSLGYGGSYLMISVIHFAVYCFFFVVSLRFVALLCRSVFVFMISHINVWKGVNGCWLYIDLLFRVIFMHQYFLGIFLVIGLHLCYHIWLLFDPFNRILDFLLVFYCTPAYGWLVPTKFFVVFLSLFVLQPCVVIKFPHVEQNLLVCDKL